MLYDQWPPLTPTFTDKRPPLQALTGQGLHTVLVGEIEGHCRYPSFYSFKLHREFFIFSKRLSLRERERLKKGIFRFSQSSAN